MARHYVDDEILNRLFVSLSTFSKEELRQKCVGCVTPFYYR